ncbi:Nucleotidylyl transferase [Gigaspora margarita]|uniref:Nucleotidylyl transferase n=1 Tax=Gigaspora margarita TaxID=4874 RepID=A0A8H3X7K8_GIGMA|nr:Nucleotidylyl transferase [Gigaspora margarita]
MNPMVPSLAGSKMPSSDPNSKIDLLDDEATVTRKLKKAFCEEGNVTDNGVLSFIKSVLIPLGSLNGQTPKFVINRPGKFGGEAIYTDYQSLEDDFREKKVHPGDLKNAASEAINKLLDPIRKKWASDPELSKLTSRTYPEPGSKITKKKESKKHNQPPKGSNTPTELPVDVSRIDVRVAKIIKAENHPKTPKSYASTVDVGDASGNPRTVASGLASHIPLEQLQGRHVVAVCNLKPARLQGIESSAMFLAASSFHLGIWNW